jgi:hypothetical protein
LADAGADRALPGLCGSSAPGSDRLSWIIWSVLSYLAGTMRGMTATSDLDPAGARSREQLAQIVAASAVPKWLMFWGHRPQADGSVGKACCS